MKIQFHNTFPQNDDKNVNSRTERHSKDIPLFACAVEKKLYSILAAILVKYVTHKWVYN